jgi:molybdopterin synthase sulfur carrier subunit
MDTPLAAERGDETGLTRARVTVRYWAAARAAAGCTEERFEAATVAAVLDQAREAHAANPSFAKVLGVSSLLLAERPVKSRTLDDVQVRDGDTLDVLPPFAGG